MRFFLIHPVTQNSGYEKIIGFTFSRGGSKDISVAQISGLFSGGSVVATKLTHETNQCNPNPVYLIAAYPFVEKSGFLKDPGADPVRFNRYPKLWFRFY
jgi:hypothetical protein